MQLLLNKKHRFSYCLETTDVNISRYYCIVVHIILKLHIWLQIIFDSYSVCFETMIYSVTGTST